MNERFFKCKCCGHCCHGQSTVSVSMDEVTTISEWLGISEEEFRRRYCVQKKNRLEMRVVNGHCIFYGPNGLCEIHAVKPFPCRQWPLHPSIVVDKTAWQAIQKDCPGFAKDISHEEIVAELIRLGNFSKK